MNKSSSASPEPIIGGLPPPAGITPNFVNPHSIAREMGILFVFFLFLSSASTMLRLYTKFFIMKDHGWGDCKYFPLEQFKLAERNH